MSIERGSFQVCPTHQINGKYGEPVAYAFREDDALLYAAAPDLLEALLAQDEVRKIGILNMTDEQIQRVDDLRRKAIAKATGDE